MRSSWLLLAVLTLRAEQPLPRELEGVGVEEKLGAAVDLNLAFTAENGYPVTLKQYFHKGRPVILNLVYYNCPMLCNLVMNGQTSALRELPWTPGEDYEIVAISIDPSETFALAGKKKQVYLAQFDRPAPGWHFLVDRDGDAKRLAEQVGFHYRYDERQRQFIHAAAIMVLTPEGKVSRYLYGIRFRPRDLRLALTEAAQSRFGLSDRFLLFCFHYDPHSRSYVLFATNLMRMGGALVVLALALAGWRIWLFEKKMRAGAA